MSPLMSSIKTVYVERPNKAILLEDCHFYHIQDLPGLSEPTKGLYDLRANVNNYLGNVDFKNKTVLEIGPSSGYLTFHMEKLGGDITAVDLGNNNKRDIVRRAKHNWQKESKDFMQKEEGKTNSFWYAHKAHNSNAKLVHCHINELPYDIGFFDISTVCATLFSIQNPFLALEKVLSHTKEKIIVTELGGYSRIKSPKNLILNLFKKNKDPIMQFLPEETRAPFKWWKLSPEIIINMAKILGFEKSKVNYHKQIANGKIVFFFTVVCERTVPIKSCNY